MQKKRVFGTKNKNSLLPEQANKLKIQEKTNKGIGNDHSFIELIIDSIQDIKGKNIVKLDLSSLDEAPATCFIICEGDSNIQMRAIGDNIYNRVKQKTNILPNNREGSNSSKWLLIDYFDIVVHIFYPTARHFYDLEDLWSDAEITAYDEV